MDKIDFLCYIKLHHKFLANNDEADSKSSYTYLFEEQRLPKTYKGTMMKKYLV